MLVGQVQDSVVGGYLLTRDQVQMDDVFLARVHSNSNIRFDMFKFSNNQLNSGKQALSVILPQMSYQGKSEICKNPEIQKRLQFKDSDKNLIIELGELKSGYFDKGASEVQTMIALLQEPKHAMDIIFSIQQAILNYNKYAGFTIGFRDILLSERTAKIIRTKNDDMMKRGCTLIDQYTKNVLNEPIGKSRWDYLQDCLKNTFSDEGLDEILSSMGMDERGNPADISTGIHNALALMTTTGSKGSFGNTKLMLIRIGQALNDNKPLPLLFDNRISAFYKKNDLDPRAYGMIFDSYLQGLTPSQLLVNAIPERTAMLNKVLTVSKPGYLGRKMIKNMEPLMVTNLRMCAKGRGITEMLFGHDGFAVQCLGRYTIPYFTDSTTDFVNKMCARVSDLPADVQRACAEHAKFIAEQVFMYKKISIWLQRVNSDHQVHGTLHIPVMLEGLVKTREHQAGIHTQSIPKTALNQVFSDNVKIIKQFVANLPHLYFNSRFDWKANAIPDYYKHAVTATALSILCCFGVDRLLRFYPEQLHLVLDHISLEIRHSMIEPGSPIGVQVAQALQEYFTQDMLDSIHKTSTGDVTRDPLERIIDIFNNKSPLQLQASEKMLPFIRIPLIPGFEGATPKQQKERADHIASNIKLIRLSMITTNWDVLFTSIERDTDATYIEDRDFITSLPQNSSQWCLRVVLDKMKMFLNRISVTEVKFALERQFQVHVLSSSDRGRSQVIRIYLLNSITFQSRNELRDIVDGFMEYAVRGLADILSATAIEETKHALDESGALKPITRVSIVAEGFNLRAIYRMQHDYPDIDYGSITTDNQHQTMQLMGIGAAKQKIINEINTLFQGKVSQKHVEFVASEMCQTGVLTNIEQNGIRARNPQNELLAMCDQRPISAIRRAALGGKRSTLEGCSAQMVVGQTPRFGTTYNQLVANEAFLLEHMQNYKSIIEKV